MIIVEYVNVLIVIYLLLNGSSVYDDITLKYTGNIF